MKKTLQQFTGSTIEDALRAAAAELGDGFTVVQARRLRRRKALGLRSDVHYELDVRATDAAPAVAAETFGEFDSVLAKVIHDIERLEAAEAGGRTPAAVGAAARGGFGEADLAGDARRPARPAAPPAGPSGPAVGPSAAGPSATVGTSAPAVPTDPAPTGPAPTDSAPTDPALSDSAPANPALTDPAPAGPEVGGLRKDTIAELLSQALGRPVEADAGPPAFAHRSSDEHRLAAETDARAERVLAASLRQPPPGEDHSAIPDTPPPLPKETDMREVRPITEEDWRAIAEPLEQVLRRRNARASTRPGEPDDAPGARPLAPPADRDHGAWAAGMASGVGAAPHRAEAERAEPAPGRPDDPITLGDTEIGARLAEAALAAAEGAPAPARPSIETHAGRRPTFEELVARRRQPNGNAAADPRPPLTLQERVAELRGRAYEPPIEAVLDYDDLDDETLDEYDDYDQYGDDEYGDYDTGDSPDHPRDDRYGEPRRAEPDLRYGDDRPRGGRQGDGRGDRPDGLRRRERELAIADDVTIIEDVTEFAGRPPDQAARAGDTRRRFEAGDRPSPAEPAPSATSPAAAEDGPPNRGAVWFDVGATPPEQRRPARVDLPATASGAAAALDQNGWGPRTAPFGEPQWSVDNLCRLGVPDEIVDPLRRLPLHGDADWMSALEEVLRLRLPAPPTKPTATSRVFVSGYEKESAIDVIKASLNGFRPGYILLDGRMVTASSIELMLAIRACLPR